MSVYSNYGQKNNKLRLSSTFWTTEAVKEDINRSTVASLREKTEKKNLNFRSFIYTYVYFLFNF